MSIIPGRNEVHDANIRPSWVVAAGEMRLDHCASRCVRGAWLCGFDPVTARSDEHRKAWVKARLKLLATHLGMEVGAV